MKKYINKSRGIARLKFGDGSTQFLFSGQSIETDKKVASLSSGVIEAPKAKQTPKTKKKSSEKAVQEESDIKNEVIDNGEQK